MTNDSAKNMLRFDEVVAETNPVAVIKQEYAEINSQREICFRESYDDLDYLVYAILPLSSEERIALVRHKHSPNTGTEICISHNTTEVASVILKALVVLNISVEDLVWVHADYKKELYEISRKLSISNKSEH